ncbi:MAG: hypothetical protein C0595_11505 [Marinilabiliales bacterium]|nr:MAG: hypothetical protein C0595_11505 [Marinilabiliales bacterium]
MKKNNSIIVIVALLLVVSCNKVVVSDIGFSSNIERNSTGLSILYINNKAKKVNLYGDIIVYEGKINVKLTSPEGDVKFSKYIQGPANFNIDTNYYATDGFWKLSYASEDGLGNIDIGLDYSYN